MTTELTLFGGLAVVLLLFALARALRMPAELAGMLAAAVPLFAYIATLFWSWPGLDVVAIHIAVFIIAAFVLAVLSRNRAKQARMHWVPKALLAFFLVLIVMNAGFLYISTQGLPPGLSRLLLPGAGDKTLHTGFAGTTRHGEEAAKTIGADLSKLHRNEQLGWRVRVEGLRMPTAGQNSVVVFADDREGKALSGLTGAFVIARPGAKGETVALEPLSEGQYETRLDFAAAGLWLVELRLGDYRQSWEIEVP
jgi:hypothetical protein